MVLLKYFFTFIVIILIGCDDTRKTKRSSKSTYIPPSTNYKGVFKKGYFRKPVSTKPNAIRNHSNSRYYYRTRGKYRRKK